MSLEFNGRTLIGGFQLDEDISEELFLATVDFTVRFQMQDFEEPLHSLLFVSAFKEPEETENSPS